jgi:hypothetical protein
VSTESPKGEDLLPLVEVLDEDVARARVVEDVAHLVVLDRLVDRHHDGRRARDGELGEDPLDAALRDDRDALAGLEAELEEAVRDPPRGDPIILPGDVLPGIADAAPEGGTVAALRGLAEELIQRHGPLRLARAGGGGGLGQHSAPRKRRILQLALSA